MKHIKKLIEIARALKPARQDFRAFHLAAIYKKNKLVSLAVNSKKSHPFALKHKYPFAANGTHAETLAILRGRQESYKGYDLYVLRIDNCNNISYSCPCEFCSALIRKVRFDNVWFSVGNNEFNRMVN